MKQELISQVELYQPISDAILESMEQIFKSDKVRDVQQIDHALDLDASIMDLKLLTSRILELLNEDISI